MKDLDKIPQKNTELAWRIIDNEAVIIPLDEQTSDSERVNFLNETGTRIWELIQLAYLCILSLSVYPES